jgi:hypothetical protein
MIASADETLRRQADLVQIAGARRTLRGFPRRLHCREQHGNKYSDDDNNNKEFHQGKSRLRPPTARAGAAGIFPVAGP